MHEKLEQLLNKLKTERAEFQERLPHGSEDFHKLWDETEQRWDKVQLQLREAGLELASKAGGLIEDVEEELREFKQEAAAKTWELHLKAKEEIHDLGEDVDKLQHKVVDKIEDVRFEVMEELHELGEEISSLYQKLRKRFD
ncbi:hypothetical protein [Candidatus Thiothrix anitrata]|jgi:hypothetical protein|uniref:Uncharacterized protein n=1 Tax=Candidatus Thiothrix anitrata TaxID=2823902 RepID=A0ABX7X1M3_9GAMM|nr:hypothetical protein [Candidatus Thiothrix anitrata]QTR49841.1 hypothetical protein J8380_16715 [Candidatus Thiothrix anitrata]